MLCILAFSSEDVQFSVANILDERTAYNELDVPLQLHNKITELSNCAIKVLTGVLKTLDLLSLIPKLNVLRIYDRESVDGPFHSKARIPRSS